MFFVNAAKKNMAIARVFCSVALCRFGFKYTISWCIVQRMKYVILWEARLDLSFKQLKLRKRVTKAATYEFEFGCIFPNLLAGLEKYGQRTGLSDGQP